MSDDRPDLAVRRRAGGHDAARDAPLDHLEDPVVTRASRPHEGQIRTADALGVRTVTFGAAGAEQGRAGAHRGTVALIRVPALRAHRERRGDAQDQE